MVSELPETTYAVLGLVDKLPGSSGYELGAVADRSFAHFWPISQTLLYTARHQSQDAQVARQTLPPRQLATAASTGLPHPRNLTER